MKDFLHLKGRIFIMTEEREHLKKLNVCFYSDCEQIEAKKSNELTVSPGWFISFLCSFVGAAKIGDYTSQV